MAQKVLVTGSNSGFGKLTVETLLKAGHSVVGSMRDAEGRNKSAADDLRGKGAHVVDVDVTNDQSADKGVAEAIELAGGIDVLVNNAGIGVIGLQEAFTIDDWKKVFDVNVFGVQRMNRAILPHFRKEGAGLLVQVSSLLGRFVLPFFGPYNASKYAVEALADNYRVELSGFGIESVIVQPGAYGTDFSSRMVPASDDQRAKTYGDFSNAPAQQMEGFEKNFDDESAPNPQMVADAVLQVIETPRGERPFRTVVDGLGMGPHIDKYNKAADETTQGIYAAFGMEGMLKLR